MAEFETVDYSKLDPLNLALTNFFAHSLPNGRLYRNTLQALVDFVAPYISALGASSYVPISGNALPDPAGTNSYSVVGAGTYTQTGEASLILTNTLNIIFWNGTTWALTKGISIDLDGYAQTTQTENVLNAAIFVDGSYLRDGGSTTSAPFSYTSNYIAVLPGQKFKIKTGLLYSGEFYNGDKNFTSNITTSDGSPDSEFTVPAGSFFMRLNVPISGRDSFYVAPSQYLGLLDVSRLNLDYKLDQNTPNLFDESTLKTGFFLLDGNEVSFSNYSYTQNYIPVEPGESYSGKLGSMYTGAIYDINKVFIGNISSTDYQIDPIYVMPDNARFVRLNIANDFIGLNYFTKTKNIGKVTSKSLITQELPSPLRTSLGTLDINTFIGAYNFVIKQLIQAKPRARIVIVTHYSKDAFNSSDLWAKTIECQKELAESMSITLINIHNFSNIFNRNGVSNFNQLLPDGIHPATDDSGECVQRLANVVFDKLQNIFDVWTGKKVAWYGTSIPAGYPKESNQNTWSYANKAIIKLGGTIQNYCVPNGVIRKAKHDGGSMGVRDTLSFTSTSSPINYQNSMLNLIGTSNEPDLFVFDYGVNDYDADSYDINKFDLKNKY